jgi:phytoene synthase
MMCAVLGVKEREAWPFAIDLGLAMQITNISRDVLEDARRERVYIPETFLAAHGTSSEKVCSEDIELKARKAVIDSMLEIAEISYTRARVGMHFIPMRARLAIFIAMRVYRSIGLSLQRNYGSDPFHGRTIVSRWGKCIAVLHGVVDFCDPRTWFARRAPASPFYTDWKELRASK